MNVNDWSAFNCDEIFIISSTSSTSIISAKTRILSTIGGVSVHVAIVAICLGSLSSHISKIEQRKAI